MKQKQIAREGYIHGFLLVVARDCRRGKSPTGVCLGATRRRSQYCAVKIDSRNRATINSDRDYSIIADLWPIVRMFISLIATLKKEKRVCFTYEAPSVAAARICPETPRSFVGDHSCFNALTTRLQRLSNI